MAEQAAEAGAHGAARRQPVLLAPSQEGIRRHVVAVADATDLPVMLYDVPGRTVVRFAPDDDRRARGPRPGRGHEGRRRRPLRRGQGHRRDRPGVVLRRRHRAAGLLAHGAVGIVSVAGHVAGRQLAEIVAAFDAGDHTTALHIFRSIIPAIDALNGAGFQAVAAKAALQVLGVLPERSVRLPLVPATDDELALVRDGLRASGLLDVRRRRSHLIPPGVP